MTDSGFQFVVATCSEAKDDVTLIRDSSQTYESTRLSGLNRRAHQNRDRQTEGRSLQPQLRLSQTILSSGKMVTKPSKGLSFVPLSRYAKHQRSLKQCAQPCIHKELFIRAEVGPRHVCLQAAARAQILARRCVLKLSELVIFERKWQDQSFPAPR